MLIQWKCTSYTVLTLFSFGYLEWQSLRQFTKLYFNVISIQEFVIKRSYKKKTWNKNINSNSNRK